MECRKITSSNRLVGWGICFLLCLGRIGGLSASAQDEEQVNFPVELQPYTLQVVDVDGRPISGVKVIAAGVRCEEDPGSWYGWPTNNAGSDNSRLSDEQGQVTIDYPVRFGRPPDWLTTTKVDFMFRHPEFVANRVEVDPRQPGIQHQMVAGCPVVFSAVDAQEVPIEAFWACMAGPGGQAEWVLQDSEISTRSVPDGAWQTMLVAPREDGRHLFSGILPTRFAQGRPVTIRGVKLNPGLRLVGKIDPQVPRPIVDGKVIAFCLPRPRGKTYDETDPSLSWSDGAAIQPDGSFEFQSLPPTGTVQLIAVCRGWVVQSTPRDGVQGFFVQGIQVNLDTLQVEDGQLAVEVPMEPAGSIEVTVVDSEGHPVSGVGVSTWPNQMLDKAGSQLLGACYPSAAVIQGRLAGKSRDALFAELSEQQVSRYSQKSDADGKVILVDIPLTSSPQHLHAYHAEFIFEGKAGLLENADGRRAGMLDFSYQMDSAQPKKIELLAVPAPQADR